MENDQTLRMALIAGMLLLLSVAAYHRLRAHLASDESLDRRQEGMFILATLRPAGLLLFAGTLAFLIRPSSMSWSAVPLPPWVRWAGIALLAIDTVFLWWTMHSLGRNLTDTVVTRRDHSLVSHGPYRWIRHPFYDAMALLVLSLSAAAANWFLLAAGAALVTLLVVRTRREEDRLVDRFGDAYRSYMASTGRFRPRVRTH